MSLTITYEGVSVTATMPAPQVTVGATGLQGAQGPEAEVPIPFAHTGALGVRTGVRGYPVPFACQVLGVIGYVASPPVGSDVIFDVNADGVTLFGTQSARPRILDGSTSMTEATGMTVTSLSAGQVLTVDVDQVGASVPGSDLTLVIRIRKV